MRNRRGSMQLSIEAIIVLVIAMVLLGLGIAFIQGFFKTGTDKLTEPFSAIQFGCDPTPAHPITTSPTNIEVKSGDDLQVKICVYANQQAPDAVVGIVGCTSTAAEAAGKKPTLLSASQTVQRTEIGGYNTILTAKDGAVDLPVGTYICTLAAVKNAPSGFPAAAPAEDTIIGRQQVTISVI